MENRREFLLTPLREGRPDVTTGTATSPQFLLTPLREGRPRSWTRPVKSASFLLTPLREGRRSKPSPAARPRKYFYSRPCGRGDLAVCGGRGMERLFLLTPLREGRPRTIIVTLVTDRFLLTPLREGRPVYLRRATAGRRISTHAPAGGATVVLFYGVRRVDDFYSRPCGRGDLPVCR